MAAWKTGRTRTLEAKGKITGSIYEDEHGESFSSVSISALGVTLSAAMTGNEANYNSEWVVTAGGAVSGTDSVPIPNTPYGDNYVMAPYDIGGTYSITVAVEEWMEITSVARSQGDIDNGVFDAPVRMGVRLYEMTVPDGAVTAQVTSGGASLSLSGTTGAGAGVSYAGHISGVCFATLRHLPGASPGEVAAAGSLRVTMNTGGVDVVGTQSAAGDGFTVSNASGLDIAVSVMGADGDQPARRGTVSTTVAPPKAFSLNGVVQAMDAPYPGEVDLDCSRYAGDPHPLLTGSGTFGVAYTQRQSSYSLYVDEAPAIDMPGGGAIYSDSGALDEWQPLSLAVNGGWCKNNGEYVTYTVTDDSESGHPTSRYVFDDACEMHGYTFPGVTLSQAGAITLDDGTDATHWTGAQAGAGGLSSTGPAMTRTFAPQKNLSGYRFLRIRNVKTDGGSHPFRVVIGGKWWTKALGGEALTATPTARDFDIDLCDPTSDASLSDNQDTRWADPNVGAGQEGDFETEVDGPLWGVTYASGITIDQLAAGVVYTLGGLSQVRHQDVTVHALPTYAPRFDDDMIQFAPAVTNDSGTVTTPKLFRLLVADTDGRQSLEMEAAQISKVEGGNSGVTYYVPHYIRIGGVSVNAGLTADQTADEGYPAGQWPGWAVAVDAPDADGTSQNLTPGYLNRDRPATWLCGGGLFYQPPPASTGAGAGTGTPIPGSAPPPSPPGGSGLPGGWTSGIGMDATNSLSLPAQMLFNSIDWYPGVNDPFGWAPAGTSDDDKKNTLYVVAHKIFRAQSHGVVLYDDHSGPALGQRVTLDQTQPVDTPLPPDTTASSVEVGSDTTTTGAAGQGEYRTKGASEGNPGALGWAHSSAVEDPTMPPVVTTSAGTATVQTVI